MSNVVGAVESTPKKVAFMSRPNAHEERIKRDEEELEALTKANEEPNEEQQEEEQQEAEPKSKEEQTFKKRYGDLRRHSQKVEKELRDKIDDLEKKYQEAAKGSMKLPKSEEEVKAWMEKYPDVAGIVETIAMQKSREASESLNKEFETLRRQQEETLYERVETQVARAHPEWYDIKESDEFYDWIDTKSKRIQNVIFEDEPDVEAISDVIDMFKTQTSYKKGKKNRDTSGAKSVDTKSERTQITDSDGKRRYKESEIKKMGDDEFMELADDIQKASREGRIIYDLSGGAR